MNTNDKNNNDSEIEGNFKINKRYCFLCNKMVDIYFVLTKDYLIFYKDQDKKKIHKKINRNLVLAINRRLRNEKDKNKLSIYYLENEKSNIIKELKLKSENRYDMEKWIIVLNKKINPKKFIFNSLSNNYVNSNEIYNFKNETEFYVALCNLEYILLKKEMKNFFEYYKNREDNLFIYENNDDINLINVSLNHKE